MRATELGYWQKRIISAQNKLTKRSIKETENQLVKYYKKSMDNCINEFELTYYKLLHTVEKGKEPTPADLYKLDRYWQMQGQLRSELEKLGRKQLTLFSHKFEQQYFDIYNSISLPSKSAFSTISKNNVRQMINQIWCADGQSWSARIWKNTDYLLETLNNELVKCVTTGQPASRLRKALIQRFGVSYSQADSIARTELAHIQTEAAKKRYEDYGIKLVEIWADEDERRCDKCGKLHEKRYPVGAAVPLPAHPRCRCCIIPVVDE